MNNQSEERVVTRAWEFKIPITITVLAHHKLDYAEALRKLKDIPKEDIFKAYLNACDSPNRREMCPTWYGGEHLEEGIYLRELTYDEKYRGKQTPEIPIPVVWDGDKDKK